MDANRDRRLLYAAAFVRAAATGMIGVLLGIYLAERGLDPAETGTVITAGLGGAAAAALAVTLAGARADPRRTLVAVSALGAAGGLALALASQLVPILAAAFLGMVNGMGRDRGAALILDQALLPATAGDDERTAAFARVHGCRPRRRRAPRQCARPRETVGEAGTSSRWLTVLLRPLGHCLVEGRRPCAVH